MPRWHIAWYRVFTVYFAIAAASLIASALRFPLHDIFLMFGICLVASFVPLIMLVYFLRGFLGNNRLS